MSDVPVRQFGVIKWFGGFNNKTGRENSFGFVAATDGTEFYLHRKDWCDAAPPIALQPVAFFAEVRSDRVCCRRASPLRASDCSLTEIHAALTALPSAPDASAGLMDAMAGLRAALHEELHSRLQTSSSRDLQDLCAANTAARSPFGVISRSSHAVTDYALMLDATGAAITSSDVWDYLPRQLIGKYEADIATQLVALAPDVVRSRVDALIEELPAPLIITLLARRSLADDAVSGALRVRLDRYLCAVILDGEAIPAYVIALAGDPRDWRWLCGSAMLQGLLDRCHFKKSLAARGTEFLEIYARAPGLARDLEYVILHELFSLVAAGNVREVVYNVFLQRLWQVLIDQQVDLYAQQHALQSLFPSCEIMGPTLSCEAFFWRENESQ